MKKFARLVVALLVTFVMNVLGDGDWKLVSITDKPISQDQQGPTLASGGKVESLPLKLPIGSKREIRNHLVSRTNMFMNIVVGLATYTPKTFELSTSLYAYDGYKDYEEMLVAARAAMVQAVAIFKTNNIPSDRMVYSILMVTYFNNEIGDIGRDRIVLAMANPASTFGMLTVDKAMSVVTIDDPSHKEQVVIPVPKLLRAEYVVDVSPTEQAKLVWTEATGPQLANWKSQKDSTVQEYVYLRSWAADGSLRSRFTLETLAGEKVTYTQYGVRMKPPTFGIRKGEVDVTVARGSDTDIATSQDMSNWRVVQSISSYQSSGSGSDYQTFTFTVPMNQSHLIISGGSY